MVGHGSKGGWDNFGPERLVTRSEGNILFELEGEFDIQIDDEQAKQVTSLQQMIDGITLLVNAKPA